MGLALTLVAALAHPAATAAVTVNLGAAFGFAVLAGSGIQHGHDHDPRGCRVVSGHLDHGFPTRGHRRHDSSD